MAAQLSMFDKAVPLAFANTDINPMRYAGTPERGTFDNVVDGPRVKTQREAVEALMNDGVWRTLAAIAAHTGASEAGASARLRDLRKKEYGARTVERKRMAPGSGLYLYRVVPR